MSDSKNKLPDAPADAPTSGKRPYVAPAVLTEDVFETMALSCGKANRFVCPGGNPDRS